MLGANRQVHGAAHGRYGVFLAGVPVGQVAGGTHLKSAQHTDVQVAAAHHGKAVGVVKVSAACQHGHRLLAGVDQVIVFMPGSWCRAHAQNAVFAVQYHFNAGRQVVGHQRGHADAQVDIGAVVNVLRHALGELLFAAFLIAHAHAAFLKPPASVATRSILTILLTNMPGVTTLSGSSAPSSTTSCTVATVKLAAVAMTGPKLRAALR